MSNATAYPFGMDPMCLRESGDLYICVGCTGHGLHRVCVDRELCTDDYCCDQACSTVACTTCDGAGSWPRDPASAFRRLFD
jgi:hypothetical protein